MGQKVQLHPFQKKSLIRSDRITPKRKTFCSLEQNNFAHLSKNNREINSENFEFLTLFPKLSKSGKTFLYQTSVFSHVELDLFRKI